MRPPRVPPTAPEEKVGYCRPPTASRFKKGKSGNPNGRPKSSRSLFNLLEAELDRRIPVVIEGRRKFVSRRELAVLRLIEAAMKGDQKALQTIWKLQAANPSPPLNETDDSSAQIAGLDRDHCQKILDDFVADLQK